VPTEARNGPAPVGPLVDREEALARSTSTGLDLLVIGGGTTGAGIALDAVSRGMSVALLERLDIASGTSSKSSKLIHGGLRYLEQYDFALVAEGVRERNLLRRNAAHQVRPLAFSIPTPDHKMHASLKAGLSIYDGLASFRNVKTHRRLDPPELLERVPGLVRDFSLGGYRYYDCQTDDARLTLQIVQAARRLGALVANHAEVVGLLRFGDRVVGAAVRDRLTGAEHEVTARWTVAATGVWADRVRGLSQDGSPAVLTPSKGIHLTFDARDVRVRDAALIASGSRDGRLVFVIPWGEQVIVGTTDDRYQGDLDTPSVDTADAGYLLHAVNRAFGTELSVRDAIGAWAGLRPLLSGGGRESAASRDLSRRHAIIEEPPGLVTIIGGKLTTYRQMAQDVVDRIVETDGDDLPCITKRLPIGPRGRIEDALRGLRDVCAVLAIDRAVAPSLLHRHGVDAAVVAAFCAERDEAEPLIESLPYLRGEVRWAVRHEMARTLDDVLQRRTRVSLRHQRAGGEEVLSVADAMGQELGWSAEERAEQVERYLTAVRRERGVVPLDRTWWERRRQGQYVPA
jgi:glycerol-3-phosphate dehydrogenase